MAILKKVYGAGAYVLWLLIVSALVVGCGRGGDDPAEVPPAMGYRATITSINDTLTAGDVKGTVNITRVGDSLTFAAALSGLVPGKMYLMHLHGSSDSTFDAQCASMEQDTNGDGFVDLIETHAVSGITMIPFHQNPVSLTIQDTTYPRALENGTITYANTVSHSAMVSAAKAKYDLQEFALDRMVVYVHGADSSDAVPETVQSLPEVPAAVTVPIGCGEVHVGG